MADCLSLSCRLYSLRCEDPTALFFLVHDSCLRGALHRRIAARRQLRGKSTSALVAGIFLDEILLVQYCVFRGHDFQRCSLRFSRTRLAVLAARMGDRTCLQWSLASRMGSALPRVLAWISDEHSDVDEFVLCSAIPSARGSDFFGPMDPCVDAWRRFYGIPGSLLPTGKGKKNAECVTLERWEAARYHFS